MLRRTKGRTRSETANRQDPRRIAPCWRPQVEHGWPRSNGKSDHQGSYL